jgi:MFS family permease
MHRLDEIERAIVWICLRKEDSRGRCMSSLRYQYFGMKAQDETARYKGAIPRGAMFVAASLTIVNPVPRHILPAIVAAQLAGASLWFAGNSAMPDLQVRAGLAVEVLGDLMSAVQLGFVIGTLVFSFFAITDRFSPRAIFLGSSLLGAACNATICIVGSHLWSLLLLRFATGFFLAGIYPVGMKIASGWFDRDLGQALGLLVGALVLGSATPHLIGHNLSWEGVMLTASAIAVLGGLVMYCLVPDGPYLRAGSGFDPTALVTIFRSPHFRASSFGYFGHMWELYAFWAFAPVYLAAQLGPSAVAHTIALWSFLIIGSGAVGCILSALLLSRYGSARIAFVQLSASGLCCLLSPVAFWLPQPAATGFLLFWGIVVVGDSPQFSALNARYAPPHLVGSALTIVNCIGFAITVVSIQVLKGALPVVGAQFMFLLLIPGPLLGLFALQRIVGKREPTSYIA